MAPTSDYHSLENSGQIAPAMATQSNDVTALCLVCNQPHGTIGVLATELIAPCSCQTYIHRTCLDKKRCTAIAIHSMTECQTCHVKYELEPISSLNPNGLKKKIDRAKLWRGLVLLAVVLFSSWILTSSGKPKFFFWHGSSVNDTIYKWFDSTKIPYFVLFALFNLVGVAVVISLFHCSRVCWPQECFRHAYYRLKENRTNKSRGGKILFDIVWFAIYVLVLFALWALVVCFVIVYFVIIGIFACVFDWHRQVRIRRLQVQQTCVRNLKPLAMV
ncbi:hypothetical protein Ae201684P_020481 [Aphanomyces euteiches]|uniref:RING-CH-type domain-containing protein n=1 Tax=Aphanomyces euteiches TaxID=100861 RepID=A0A6G0WFB3_9STRA|nr:hypothetical protein Ae201684_015599 [Aphanomyces euteiches]KAH9084232.1 hypothetical protein Ae201684P_020481 [Aphanomyces euteiches]KAH9155455.1 hypothetical protein AeRB84_002574 [Aphanomyces euteiches]